MKYSFQLFVVEALLVLMNTSLIFSSLCHGRYRFPESKIPDRTEKEINQGEKAKSAMYQQRFARVKSMTQDMDAVVNAMLKLDALEVRK